MLRVVKTENGMVRGLPAADPRITSFKGIPFAAPPVGENRWRAPQPVKNWEGVRDTYEFAPISVQDQPGVGTDIYCREWHVDPDIPMNEDCLYLNVWTPAKTGDEKFPVLVWFFGGGYQWGYTAEMEFDGERLARRGIIVVTVNYRLGALGFLAHPEITKEAPEAPANFGNLDQQAGLNWTIRNIAAFGGDPENITIAGQSAGGGSVMTQLATESNYGRFQRAIVLSGMIRSPYMPNPFMIPRTLSEAEKSGEDFFSFLGVKSLEEARALDAFYIRDKYAEYRPGHGMFTTVEDGVYLKGDPMKRIMTNDYNRVPIMAGNTEDEFFSAIPAASEEELRAIAEKLFGEDADAFMAFPEATTKQGDNQYAAVSSIEAAVKNVCLQVEANGSPKSYYYRFAPDIPGWDNPGTFHSVDLWFFFETLAKCWRPFVGRHYDLARQMANYWANFIKTGDPNGEDADGSKLPEWRPYTKNDLCEMVFTADGAKTAVEDDPFMQFLVTQVNKQLKG